MAISKQVSHLSVDECAAPSPKKVTFGEPSRVQSKGTAGILKHKEKSSIKALNFQHNKENTPENTSHLNNTNVSFNTSFNTTINTSTTSINTSISRKPASKKERPHVTSVEALFAKNKAAPANILKNTPTRESFKKLKSKTQPFHPYQRPNDSKSNTSLRANSLYEDHTWVEKQEKGFEKWLNFIFSPYYDDEDILKSTNIISGPGVLSYRELACQRRQSLLRLDLMKLMNTEEYKNMIPKMETVWLF